MPDTPKGLPDTVAARLDDLAGVCTRFRGDLVESRLSSELEVRMVSDDRAQVHGYATVYDFPYDIAGGPDMGGFTETIARGATKRSVKNGADVRFLINHDGIPLARTKSGTMTLRSDDTGLLVDADLNLRSSEARDAVLAMERGDLDEMSFAFQVLDQEWNSDYTLRTVREVRLFDVSLVTYPANPAASAYVKPPEPAPARGMSLSLALAQADALKLTR